MFSDISFVEHLPKAKTSLLYCTTYLLGLVQFSAEDTGEKSFKGKKLLPIEVCKPRC